jgi:hypothetical protein
MIAVAALVVAAGAASAQTLTETLTAAIPFEFRAAGRVMAPGTYRVEASRITGTPVFDLVNANSGAGIILLPQAPVDPERTWKGKGQGKLVFACVSGSCALAELWDGSDSDNAYTFRRPKLGKDETAALKEIPLQARKSE